MPEEKLSAAELAALVQRVFAPTEHDHALALLVDLPDSADDDTSLWRARRAMAAEWAMRLEEQQSRLGLQVRLYLYRAVRADNADLPGVAWRCAPRQVPRTAVGLDAGAAEPFRDVFSACRLLLAVTERSATAPLKLAAPTFGFRAATMPGFTAAMIPALRLDYVEINRRVSRLKDLLDRAERAELRFTVDNGGEHVLTLDLRHRTAHASGGVLHTPGTAGNLPSGEAYVVPYEGERAGDPSRSRGELPVQLGDEVVLYTIDNNVAVRASGAGAATQREADHLAREPAYGNMAELGLGVLGDFGVAPTGERLLDEKLGLHIAFGRSDHFGGQVGAARFSRPEEVVHIDRVYLPSMQPRVHAASVDLELPDGTVPLIRDGRYVIAWTD
jgi:hypothetical protein